MTLRAAQKRLLLGWLALLAPLPLPFNDGRRLAVTAPTGGQSPSSCARGARRTARWLPAWAMNLLGLAYLPFFFARPAGARAAGSSCGRSSTSALFALLVKLFAIGQERDKWQVALGRLLRLPGGDGHQRPPLGRLYLIVFVALTLMLLARFAYLHVLAGFGRVDVPAPELPVRAS